MAKSSLKVEVQKSIRIVTYTTYHEEEYKHSSRAYTTAHHASAAYTGARMARFKNRPKTPEAWEELRRKTYNRVRPIFEKILDK